MHMNPQHAPTRAHTQHQARREDDITFSCNLGNPTFSWNLRWAAKNAAWADASQGQRKLNCVSLSIHPEEDPLHFSQQTNSQRAPGGSRFIYLTFACHRKQACHTCWHKRSLWVTCPPECAWEGTLLGMEQELAARDSSHVVRAEYPALVGSGLRRQSLSNVLYSNGPCQGSVSLFFCEGVTKTSLQSSCFSLILWSCSSWFYWIPLLKQSCF